MKFTPGSGRRRPLHPGRSLLPGLARPRVRLHRPLHRARRRHQLRDAAPRRRPGRRGAQRPRPRAQGREGRGPRRRLQAERPRRAQLPGRRRPGRSRRPRRGCPVPRSRTSTAFTRLDRSGPRGDAAPRAARTGPTSIVVVTAHSRHRLGRGLRATPISSSTPSTLREDAPPAPARCCAWGRMVERPLSAGRPPGRCRGTTGRARAAAGPS